MLRRFVFGADSLGEKRKRAPRHFDRRMSDGTGKQGISREGPLRSITAPPFAGPVAFVNSGPLAHTHTAAPTSTSPPSNTSAGLSPALSASLAPSFPHAAGPGTLQAGAYTATDYGSQQQQQQQLLSQIPPGGQTNAFADNAGQNAGHFARHPQQSDESASADPLSHLLQGGLPTTNDGRPVPAESREGRTSSAASARFDYGNVPQVQTQAPPLAAEPVRWSSPAAAVAGGVVGQQDGFRERAPVVSPSRAMPALPPPPPGHYAAAPQAVHSQPPSPQEKGLDELVAEFLSSDAPPPPEGGDETLSLGSPDGWVEMLGQLARRRAWKRLVEISASMLVAHRGGGAPGLTAEQAMDLRLRRALGMLRLGKATEAAEVAAEAGQEAGQPPLAAISVAARLATAGAKAYCEGETEDEGLEELAALKSELEGIIAASSGAAASTSSAEDGGAVPLTVEEATIWRRRVTSSLANAFVRRGNWRQALGLLEAIGEEQCPPSPRSGNAAADGNESETALIQGGAPTAEGGAVEGGGVAGEAAAVGTFRVEVLSRIGRVFLQLGALKDAEVYFHRAEEASLSPEDSPRILIDRGLHLFSKNEFVAAQQSFQKAADAVVAEGEPPDHTHDNWLWATLDEGAGLLDSALNNLSLAMVYSCDVMRGVQTLEGLIRKDPRLYMLDVVVFNLCTLYDLSFDAVASAKKKRTLQAVARRFRLEDIDPSSFRMS